MMKSVVHVAEVINPSPISDMELMWRLELRHSLIFLEMGLILPFMTNSFSIYFTLVFCAKAMGKGLLELCQYNMFITCQKHISMSIYLIYLYKVLSSFL